METIIKYKSLDGILFDDSSQCVSYENNYHVVKYIMEFMGEKPISPDFNLGEYCIQHDLALLEEAKNNLIAIATNILGLTGRVDLAYLIMYTDFTPAFAYIRRSADRLYNCDNLGREWGQYFYVLHIPDVFETKFVDSNVVK